MPDSTQPVVCVLRDGQSQRWTVSICDGHGAMRPTATYESFAEATEAAYQEQARRRAVLGTNIMVTFPDDCPCIPNPPGTASTK